MYGGEWHSVAVRTAFSVGLQTLLILTTVISLPQALASTSQLGLVIFIDQLCIYIYIYHGYCK